MASALLAGEVARLSPEQRDFFETNGYLVVRDALDAELVARLTEAVDRLYARARSERGLGEYDHWELRNCLPEDEAFLALLDHPRTLPLVIELLNWNLQLITSHLVIRAPAPPGVDPRTRAGGWHRDGGTAPSELPEPHHRMFIKIAYFLNDLSEPGRGQFRVVPGSHRLIGRPPKVEGPDPHGAIEVLTRPGDAVLFENRIWHCAGPNFSPFPRKSLFFGYGYRWLRPMDYVAMPPDLLARCDPIQRQLLGDVKSVLGFYLPTDEDVPLRAWWRERQASPNGAG